MSKIRLGVDFYFASHNERRGIGNYSYNLYKKLCYDDVLDVILFIPKSAVVDNDDFPGAEIVRLPTNHYLLNENLFVPIYAFLKKADYVHFTANSVGFLSLFINLRICVTIHDTMFMDLSFKSLSNPAQFLSRLYRMVTLKLSGSRVSKVFTVSQYSASKIKTALPGIRPEKIIVTYQGVGDLFATALETTTLCSFPKMPDNRAFREYFLAVGAKEPRKNLSGLIRSFAHFLSDTEVTRSPENIGLIIAGLDDVAYDTARVLCIELQILDSVVLVKFVNNYDLVALYASASAFIFISTEEGFGIPLLEAFSVGCPVICSNTSSLAEIAGDAAILVDPLSAIDVARAMTEILHDDVRAYLIKSGGVNLKKFSWDLVTNVIYESLSD